MGLLLKIKNSIFILLILIILVAVICATAFIFKQNKEYTKLNQEYIVKEKSVEVETVEEEVRTETDLPVLDEDRTVTGNGDIEFRSGSDIIIF